MHLVSRILCPCLAVLLMALSFGAHAQDESSIIQSRHAGP
jgi:hypothetical protein